MFVSLDMPGVRFVCTFCVTFHPHPSLAWMDPSVSLCIHEHSALEISLSMSYTLKLARLLVWNANGYCNTHSLQLPCTRAYNSHAQRGGTSHTRLSASLHTVVPKPQFTVLVYFDHTVQ